MGPCFHRRAYRPIRRTTGRVPEVAAAPVFPPPPLADAHVVGFGRPRQVACIHLPYLGRSGGRGGGALVERGVHPDLDIALEGSRDQAVLFGFMSGLVERGLIGTRNHTVDVELA